MGIKFKPMTDKDFKDLKSDIVTSVSASAYSPLNILEASELFGNKTGHNRAKVYRQRENRRAVYRFDKPVYNLVLARHKCSFLAKILGLKQSDYQAIFNFDYAWVKGYGLIPTSDVPDGKPYLLGPEIFRMYIDKFDINTEIERELNVMLSSCLGKKWYEKAAVVKMKTPYPAVGEFYLNPIGEQKPLFMRALENLQYAIVDKFFYTDESRFSLLVNMPSKDVLYAMVPTAITVLPPDMHPDTDMGKDPLTRNYADIINADRELSVVSHQNISAEHLKTLYKDLCDKVSYLLYQHQDTPKHRNDRSILERMKGKHGTIREHNLGKRQDYSARAAVVINPFLSIGRINLPKRSIPKLFRYHLYPYLDPDTICNISSVTRNDECIKLLEEKGILENVPVMLGRQPTLHKHGIQGFFVGVSNSTATEVNPLVCPAYNMDFDGDTGWDEVPITPEAISELKNLILTTKNLYLAKNGDCTIVPRQDMLYGLYMCTQEEYGSGRGNGGHFPSLNSVKKAVMEHRVKVWETVSCQGFTEPAGYLAFRACFPFGKKMDVVQIDKRSIKKYVNDLLKCDDETFVKSIDDLVELGFKVARLYSSSLSLLRPLNSGTETTDAYDSAYDQFREDMKEVDELYDLGLEDTSNYNMEYDKNYDKFRDSIEKGIFDKLGKNNSYYIMAKSGARGDASNLAQMFAYKGRVQKNALESFNVFIKNSCVSQMTSLEHSMSAYGGRKGQMDKSLKTGDTGYAMRQMWHATSYLVITSRDCGTKDGIEISKKDISIFEDDKDKVKSIFKSMITGRFMAQTGLLITPTLADQYAESMDSVVIRSPITCDNPCCSKCYGIDPNTHGVVNVGAAIGFSAATSIGEPGTQMTMKQFQKGGVASSKGDVTSAFDKMNLYIQAADLYTQSRNGKFPTYDPIAWGDGKVSKVSNLNNVKVYIGDDRTHYVELPRDVILKDEVKKGEGLCIIRGDHSLREIEAYLGIRAAQTYLLHQLFNIYRAQEEIISKHFEVLIAGMTRHVILSSDRADLKVGQYYTSSELKRGSLDNVRYVSRLLDVQKLPLKSQSPIENFNYGWQSEGLSKALVLGREERLDDPISRIVMGLPPKLGTYYPDFATEYRRER